MTPFLHFLLLKHGTMCFHTKRAFAADKNRTLNIFVSEFSPLLWTTLSVVSCVSLTTVNYIDPSPKQPQQFIIHKLTDFFLVPSGRLFVSGSLRATKSWTSTTVWPRMVGGKGRWRVTIQKFTNDLNRGLCVITKNWNAENAFSGISYNSLVTWHDKIHFIWIAIVRDLTVSAIKRSDKLWMKVLVLLPPIIIE